MEQGRKGESAITDISEALRTAIEAVQKSNEAEKEKTKQLITLQHEQEIQKQNAIAHARVLSGKAVLGQDGEEVVPAVDPNTAAIEKNKSIDVQSATALITSLFSLLWITYIGADAPPEVYAAVAALVPIIGQGVATAINNRK